MGPEVVEIDVFHFPELLWQPAFLIKSLMFLRTCVWKHFVTGTMLSKGTGRAHDFWHSFYTHYMLSYAPLASLSLYFLPTPHQAWSLCRSITILGNILIIDYRFFECWFTYCFYVINLNCTCLHKLWLRKCSITYLQCHICIIELMYAHKVNKWQGTYWSYKES